MENKEKYLLPEIKIISFENDEVLTVSLGTARMTGYYEDDELLS